MKHELVAERRAFVAELCQHGEEALTDDALFYEVLEAGYLCTKEIVRNDRRSLGIGRKTVWERGAIKTYAKKYIETFMPEPYRTAALENIKRFRFQPYKPIDCMSEALDYAFRWKLTEQGHNFWFACSCEPDFSKWPELPNIKETE